MLVIIRNTMVELPPLEAEMLLHRGIAHLPEVADLPMQTRYESSGTATLPFSSPPVTVRKSASSHQAHQRRSRSSNPRHVRTRRSFV
jgi:hypothetical protein